MGRWTSKHYDDVLGSKIKSLVSGSVRRAKLEQEETITYETFVEELDSGDSFTAALVDLLVKEVAARHARENVEEKRLIADGTAKGLRMLASRGCVYRPRRTGFGPVRRSHVMTDYLAFPPDEMDLDDDGDSTDSVLDPITGTVEGARINSNVLWDTFAPRSSSPGPTDGIPILRRAASRARDSTSPYHNPLTTTSRASTFNPHSRNVLDLYTDQPDPNNPTGVWRPSRRSGHPRRLSSAPAPPVSSASASARASEFASFSARRRPSVRESPAPASTSAAIGTTAPTSAAAEEGENEAEPAQPRRFFPNVRPEWSSSEHDYGERTSHEFLSWLSGAGPNGLPPLPAPTSLSMHDEPPSSASTPEGEDTSASHSLSTSTHGSGSAQPAPPASSVTSGPADGHREAPRLRRGGVRPPEAMLGWHISMHAEGRRRRAERMSGAAPSSVPTPATSGNGASTQEDAWSVPPWAASASTSEA